MSKISVLIMVKDEADCIGKTIESIKNNVILYDTGSTDNTIHIVDELCRQYNIPLYIKEGEFVDFSTSRNILFDFADEVSGADYYLLLDANDELKSELYDLCNHFKEKDDYAFFLSQEWLINGSCIIYKNKLVKAEKKIHNLTVI